MRIHKQCKYQKRPVCLPACGALHVSRCFCSVLHAFAVLFSVLLPFLCSCVPMFKTSRAIWHILSCSPAVSMQDEQLRCSYTDTWPPGILYSVLSTSAQVRSAQYSAQCAQVCSPQCSVPCSVQFCFPTRTCAQCAQVQVVLQVSLLVVLNFKCDFGDGLQ